MRMRIPVDWRRYRATRIWEKVRLKTLLGEIATEYSDSRTSLSGGLGAVHTDRHVTAFRISGCTYNKTKHNLIQAFSHRRQSSARLRNLPSSAPATLRGNAGMKAGLSAGGQLSVASRYVP